MNNKKQKTKIMLGMIILFIIIGKTAIYAVEHYALYDESADWIVKTVLGQTTSRVITWQNTLGLQEDNDYSMMNCAGCGSFDDVVNTIHATSVKMKKEMTKEFIKEQLESERLKTELDVVNQGIKEGHFDVYKDINNVESLKKFASIVTAHNTEVKGEVQQPEGEDIFGNEQEGDGSKWEDTTEGKKYVLKNGEYAKGWCQIKNDKGIIKYYYFDENGIMQKSTYTPDGYYLNSSGEWDGKEAKQDKITGEPVESNSNTKVPKVDEGYVEQKKESEKQVEEESKETVTGIIILGDKGGSSGSGGSQAVNPDDYKVSNPQGSADLSRKVSTITTVLKIVGAVIAVIIMMIMGIKYMTGSIEEKAEYKKMLVPYVIGVALIAGNGWIIQFIASMVLQLQI